MALATPFPASFPASFPESFPESPASQTSVRRPRPAQVRPAPIRLTRRGKLVVTMLGSLALFTVLQGTGALEAAAGAVSRDSGTAVVVVQPGESLWTIAERVAPTTDPRSTILLIRELNGLAPGAVPQAGQGLVVPR